MHFCGIWCCRKMFFLIYTVSPYQNFECIFIFLFFCGKSCCRIKYYVHIESPYQNYECIFCGNRCCRTRFYAHIVSPYQYYECIFYGKWWRTVYSNIISSLLSACVFLNWQIRISFMKMCVLYSRKYIA